MRRPPPILVTDDSGFRAMLDQLRREPRVAVDTEADSLYSYFEKVCLIQFSIPGEDYILDTLTFKAIEPLGELFADPRVQLVFHAAEYDIMSLKRDYGFAFMNLFDTMVAARILGWKQVGLGAILEQQFGVRLDKRFQRADWGRRPLTPDLIEYARDDTHYLLALHDLQRVELERKGRMEEAQEEFARLAQVTWSGREFNPNRYAALPGAKELDPVELGVLRELYHFRETQARKEDRPPFKVLANTTLLRLARSRPETLSELAAVPGVGEWFVRRHGRGALQAIERGREHPQHRLPSLTGRRPPSLTEHAMRDRYARLKEWRRERAEARGVEPDVILPNETLVELARQRPHTLEGLEAILGAGAWKLREYGDEILQVLNGKGK